VREPFNQGVNISVINALGLRGLCAPMMIEGAVDQAVFDLYVEHFLVPKLYSGDVVLLDNVTFHHSPHAIRLIEQAGARVEHLPAYSPDFNPIEQCISKLKAILRGIKADTQRKLRNALARAMEQVTLKDIRGWFSHCGYTYSLN
jgi:transposase